jgi:hypothetical protein
MFRCDRPYPRSVSPGDQRQHEQERMLPSSLGRSSSRGTFSKATGVSRVSIEISGRSAAGALKSFSGGPNSVEVTQGCPYLPEAHQRPGYEEEEWNAVEVYGVIGTTAAHSSKGIFLPPGVAAVDDGLGSSAVFTGGFHKEDGGG